MNESLQELGVALGLGLLVGLQRQWADSDLAGIRTFPLITLLGAICALLAPSFGGWAVAAGLVVTALMLGVGDLARIGQGKKVEGVTTEMAALVMFGVGALSIGDTTGLAVVAGGVVAVLLHWKQPLHHFVEAIEANDLRGVMQLVLVALVLLPAMPDADYGPYDVVNPQHAWLMVVLIVGISLAGHVAQRLLGGERGTLVAGLLGGLVSSTATTVAEARETRAGPGLDGHATVLVVLASAVAFVRLLVEIAIAAPAVLADTAAPLGTMAVVMALLAAGTYFFSARGPAHEVVQSEPTDLKGAVAFGALYVVVLVAVEAVRRNFGDVGLYPVAALSGLTDVDAITLSTANLAREGRLEPSIAWRIVLVAALANVTFKLGVVVLLGSRAMAQRVATVFGLALVAGVVLLVAWP